MGRDWNTLSSWDRSGETKPDNSERLDMFNNLEATYQIDGKTLDSNYMLGVGKYHRAW